MARRIDLSIWENGNGDSAQWVEGELSLDINNSYDKHFDSKAQLQSWLKDNGYEWAGCDKIYV
jgi:hypothetical protein